MTQIKIQGHLFEVPEGVLAKYAEGSVHTLDAAHAATLKRVFCETLRNNFTGKVKKAINGGEASEAQLRALQDEFDNYAQDYSFGARRARGPARVKRDPIEVQARKLAAKELAAAYKARHGQAADKDRLSAAVDDLMSKKGKEYMQRARVILRETDRVAENVLDEVEGF